MPGFPRLSPASQSTDDASSRWAEVVSAFARFRRLIAAVLMAVAVLLALEAVAPPAPATTLVVTAARDVDGGVVLTSGDLALTPVPRDSAPSRALTDVTSTTGRLVAGPVRRGEVLTDVRIVGPSLLAGAPPGFLATPVRVADPAVAALLSPGDVVDVIGVGDGVGGDAVMDVRARARTVLATGLGAASDAEVGGLSGLGGGSGNEGGGVVLLALPPNEAVAVAAAAAASALTIAVHAR